MFPKSHIRPQLRINSELRFQFSVQLNIKCALCTIVSIQTPAVYAFPL